MYKVTFTNTQTVALRDYYFEKKPDANARLGAGLEYLEYLLSGGGSFWSQAMVNAKYLRFVEKQKGNCGYLLIYMGVSCELLLTYEVCKLRIARSPESFYTSKWSGIRKFVKERLG